jgi:Zn-dependent protease/CBS domain-containing protein
MDGSFRIGRLFGIPILIHFTFLLIIPLFAWIIASQIATTTDMVQQIFHVTIDNSLITAGFMPYILGTIIALGLFAGVLVHELAHSLIARYSGIRINSITLLIFGGVASMDEGLPDPVVELPMALIGPLTSLLLGLVCSGLVYVAPSIAKDPAAAGVLIFVFGYLGLLNVILFAFNLLPAFPMDGGRVLRSLLALGLGYQKATRIAVGLGHVFALVFAYYGIIKANIILIAIAVFIYIAASNEELQANVRETLKKFRISDILPRDFTVLSADATLAKVLEIVFHSHQEDFPVVESGEMTGFVTRQDIMKGVHSRGTGSAVRDIMRARVPKVKGSDTLMKAQALMQEAGMRALPVVDKGKVKGVVTLEDIGRVYSMAHE